MAGITDENESGVLYVRVIEAKNIIGAGKQGLSNAYCITRSSFNKQTFKTSTVKKSVSPTWDATFKFYTSVLSGYIKLVIDHDRWVIPERLGKVRLPIDLLKTQNPIDQWFPLDEPKRCKSRPNPAEEAKVHVSLYYPSARAAPAKITPQIQQKTRISDRFKFDRTLGRGGFSVVYGGVDLETKAPVAIKAVSCTASQYDLKLLHREIDIMRKLDHPNIIKLFDVIEDENNIYLIMELVTGGELFDQIITRGSFSEADAASIVRQILEAVSYMHSNGIAHRDLKPENLLVSGPNSDHIKVTDFGLSKNFGNATLFTSCGTPDYVAPEVLKGAPYDNRVDMWSTGVITYILVCGYPPFYGQNDQEIFSKILFAKYDFNPDCWDAVSADAKNFISSLLVLEANKRPTAEEALKHPWLVGNAPTSALTTFKKDAFESYTDMRNRQRWKFEA